MLASMGTLGAAARGVERQSEKQKNNKKQINKKKQLVVKMGRRLVQKEKVLPVRKILKDERTESRLSGKVA